MQHEVVVIAHQAIGQGLGIETRQRLGYDLQQSVPVLVIDEDWLAPVTAGSDVIDSTREFDTQRTGHAGTLHREEAKGKA